MTWSDRSRNAMTGVNPELIAIMEEVRRRSGVPFEVTEGLRDEARQRELLAEGKSQTMDSKHLTGNAVDIFIPTPGGGADWDFESYRPLGEMFKTVAQERGTPQAVWGGDWKTLRDGVNFQLNGSDYRAPGGQAQQGPALSFGPEVPKMDTSVAGMFNPQMALAAMIEPETALGDRLMGRRPPQAEDAQAAKRKALADLIRY